MDPMLSAQDVLRCDPCGTPVPPSYCIYCHVNLCEACTEDHLSDESKIHKVVSIEQRAFISHYDKDANNVTIQCDQGAQKKVDKFEKFESDKEIQQKKIEKKVIHARRNRRKQYRTINFRMKELQEKQQKLAYLLFEDIYFKSDEYYKWEPNFEMWQHLALKSETSFYKDIGLQEKRENANEMLPFYLLFFLFLYSYCVCFYQ